MICKGCKHFTTRTIPKPAQFLIYGCKLKKLKFGVYTDIVKTMPKHCKEKEKYELCRLEEKK